MNASYAEYQHDKPPAIPSRPFIDVAEPSWPKIAYKVMLGAAVEGYTIMTYLCEDESGYQRLFGTDVVLGEWE